MKTKLASVFFLVLFSTASFAEYVGDYCNYNGIYADSSISKDEEFSMLLDRLESPNFMGITRAIAAVAIANKKDLNDPKCQIYNYARKLMEYYRKNEDKILVNKDKQYLTELISCIEKKLKE